MLRQVRVERRVRQPEVGTVHAIYCDKNYIKMNIKPSNTKATRYFVYDRVTGNESGKLNGYTRDHARQIARVWHDEAVIYGDFNNPPGRFQVLECGTCLFDWSPA